MSIDGGSAEAIKAELNEMIGIRVPLGSVSRSHARRNGGSGIRASLVQESLAHRNREVGIKASAVRGSMAFGNYIAGIEPGAISIGGKVSDAKVY